MARMTDIAAILRDAGLPVREVPGWQSRGHGAMGPVLGVLCHHTAGAASGNYPSERIVVNGRPGLAGPLAQLGLARDGTWIVIAAGQAWHAGTGSMSWVPGRRGNTHLIGIEAESVGTRDDWTPQQRAGYPRGVATLLEAFGLPASRAIGHKEWAPGRKIDPAYWDMRAFRAEVARLMAGGPAPTPTAPDEGDDMGMQQFLIPPAEGVRSMRLIVPTGKASSVTARAWISMVVNGDRKGSGRVWAQDDDSGIADKWFNMPFANGRSARDWWELPNGTTQINVHYDMPDGGCITLEWAGK
jgi:hypothetical protein